MWTWMRWIDDNLQALRAGKKLCVRQDLLVHPQCVDEFRPVQGWPMGQTCDWAFARDDGSRVHVQCYVARDGTPMFCIHRDRWDPDRSIGNAFKHMIFETPGGQILGAGAGIGAMFLVIKAVSSSG